MVTRGFKVKDLRKVYFPALGTYANTWGLTVEGKSIASFELCRNNLIRYYNWMGQVTHVFQDECYLDD